MKKWSFATQGDTTTIIYGDIMKEYVLKIGFDPVTEKIIYIKEYIEGARGVLQVNDEDIELDEEIADIIELDTIGLA